MLLWFDPTEYAFDPAIRANQIGGALDPPEGFAVHRFFDPNIVLFGNLVVLVGQQHERQTFFDLEFGLLLNRVGAKADNDGVGRFIFIEVVTDSLGLFRSATGHSFGEEVEHDIFSPKV